MMIQGESKHEQSRELVVWGDARGRRLPSLLNTSAYSKYRTLTGSIHVELLDASETSVA